MLIQEYYEGTSKYLAKAQERLVQLKNMVKTGKLGLNDVSVK